MAQCVHCGHVPSTRAVASAAVAHLLQACSDSWFKHFTTKSANLHADPHTAGMAATISVHLQDLYGKHCLQLCQMRFARHIRQTMPHKGERTADTVGKWESFTGQTKISWLSLSLPLLHDISQASTCIPGSFKHVVLACWDAQNWSF